MQAAEHVATHLQQPFSSLTIHHARGGGGREEDWEEEERDRLMLRCVQQRTQAIVKLTYVVQILGSSLYYRTDENFPIIRPPPPLPLLRPSASRRPR